MTALAARGHCLLVLLATLIGAIAVTCVPVAPFDVLWVQGIDKFDVGYYTQSRIPGNDPAGPPLISYFDGGCGRLKALQCLDASCSTMDIIVVAGECDDGLLTGRYQSQTILPNGNPFFAYYTDFALVASSCSSPFCNDTESSTFHVVDPITNYANSTGYYTDVVVGSDGLPFIAYYDSMNETLKVAACLDIACSDATVTQLNQNGAGGKYPSVAIGTDGMPVLSFYGSDSLQVAVCGDIHCANLDLVTIYTLDTSSGDVGRYTYIQIGSDGMPVMMYVDEDNGWLKVAHCEDAKCAGRVSKTVVDEIGISAYGEFPEMQINPVNGLAVLTYFNQTNTTSGSLKIAQCMDLACTEALVQVIDTQQCGYGRDSSLSFSSLGYIYVSFLDYRPGIRKRAGLAVLMQFGSVAYEKHKDDDHHPLPAIFGMDETRSTPSELGPVGFDIDDICQDR